MTALLRFRTAVSTGAVLSACALLAAAPAQAGALPGPVASQHSHAVAPTGVGPVSDNASLVDAWYEDWLGRQAYGDPGAQYWVDRLEVQAPADVLWAITHGNELNQATITYYYEGYLGREPDAGARYWVEGANAQRFPLEWVDQNIASSPEFVRAAQRRGTLVQQWYAVVFGEDTDRLPSPGEVAYWNARVRAVGALGAFRELYYAPEVVTSRVQVWYAFLLKRQPSAGEIAYWYPKEIESDINVGVLIASTQEYRNYDRPAIDFD